MITPLQSQDSLDVAGLEKLVEHMIRGGVHGIFMLGTTGESACLSYRLRREVIQRACAFTAGRVPIVVGITDTAVEESVALGDFAAENGAAAVVIAPPFSMPPGQAELRLYLKHLTSRIPIPSVLYHCPPLTKTEFSLETVRWAMDQPQIIGLKDSSGNLAYFEALCSFLPQRPAWRLLVGPEELLATTVRMGGHGGVCGGANLFPRLYVDFFEAAKAGRADVIKQLQDAVIAVGQGLYRFENHATSFIKGLKAALAFEGICNGEMALPFAPLALDQMQALHANLLALQKKLETGEGTA